MRSSWSSFGGRHLLLASLQEPGKVLPSCSSILRNSFFGLEFHLGSNLLHWIGSLYHHRNVLWFFILILAVEMLFGTIEVFFGSYTIHMKCSLVPRKSSWNSSRPK